MTARLGLVAFLGVSLFACACRDQPSRERASAAPASRAREKPVVRELPPGKAFAWVEAERYRLRIFDVWPCHEPREAQAAPPQGAERLGEPRPYRLGVSVEIESLDATNTSPVVATPAGAELVKNGKAFRAQRKPSSTPSCNTFLATERLRPGEIARGTLVFEAPDVDYLRSAVLRFEPPRWGHESRVSVTLPDCFGRACPNSEAKLAGRDPP